MIELLTDQQDVLKFVYLDDKIESMLNMSKSTWIQWLQDSISNDAILTWISRDGKDINGYIVAVNNITPPTSNSVLLYYIWVANQNKFVDGSFSRESLRIGLELTTKVKDWAVELGANEVIAKTVVPVKIYEMFGFKEVARFVVCPVM